MGKPKGTDSERGILTVAVLNQEEASVRSISEIITELVAAQKVGRRVNVAKLKTDIARKHGYEAPRVLDSIRTKRHSKTYGNYCGHP
jgi:hypothetical protein